MPDTGLADVSMEFAVARATDGADPAHVALILNGLTRGLASFDATGRLRFVSNPLVEILGLSPACRRIGTKLRTLLADSPLLDGDALEAILAASLATVRDGQPRQLEVVAGTPRQSLAIELRPLPDGTAFLRLEDTTERREAAARALADAQHDPLTGLPGRQLFSERLASRLAPSADEAARLAVLMVDLDRFKAVNDTLGHLVGDELLRLVASRMRSVLPGNAMLTRFGGDEFGILLDGVDAPGARAIGEQMLEILGRPYLACGHLVNVGASIGIARAPDHAPDAETLVRYADLALYSVKAIGRNRCAAFEPAMDARAHARRLLEIDLRRALTLEQLEVHYQPQVALKGDTLSGFEALVRWRHPDRGMIPPAEFVPLAEEIGLIGAIGEWVLRAACREAATWPAPLTLAVNVSGRQFEDPSLVDIVRRALAASGLAGARLEIEITESVLMRNEGVVVAMLHELRALGVRVAMDDFGTGHSSLSQLRSFPFDKIKIDRSFVGDRAPSRNRAIIRAIAAMGASLGMETIAEGVETGEELAQIRAEGCDAVQGYFFGRPVPAADVAALIATLDDAGLAPA